MVRFHDEFSFHTSPQGLLSMSYTWRPFLLSFFACVACSSLSDAQTVKESPDAQVTLLADGFKFTEGPAVDSAGNVYFTDQPNDRIMKVDLENRVTEYMKPAGRSNGMFFAPDGKLIACADEKNEMWSISTDKSKAVLFNSFEDHKLNGPNDVWIDSNGSMYFTDPYYQRPWWEHKKQPQKKQALYRADRDGGNIRVMDDSLEQPNGIVGDSKRRLVFVADIRAGKTYQYNIANDGSLVDRKLFCSLGSDGMTLDSQGNLYLTGKPGVTVFDSSGKQIEVIAVPESWTANVCIGGRDRKTLFITASDSVYTIRIKHSGL
jgi:gluconolactonase